jgi:RNA polymerase sigma factor (sigma-70 family)
LLDFHCFAAADVICLQATAADCERTMEYPDDDLIRTRTTLIHRLKDWQDQTSWQDFFDTYWKLIYKLALKGGLGETEAQDVVQETMISVAKHMPTFKYDRKIGSFKSWLYNMARWRVIDHLRKRQRLSDLSRESAINSQANQAILEPINAELEALWEAEWEKNLIDAAVSRVKRRLNPQKYQVFDFYVNKEWPAPKVAETFDIPVAQVYLAKHRVAEMIKSEIQRLKEEIC